MVTWLQSKEETYYSGEQKQTIKKYQRTRGFPFPEETGQQTKRDNWILVVIYLGKPTQGQELNSMTYSVINYRLYLQPNPTYQDIHAVPSHTALLHKGRARNQADE